MYKDVLRTMDAETIYTVAALLIFFGWFLFTLWTTWRTDRRVIEEVSRIPLDDDEAHLVPENPNR